MARVTLLVAEWCPVCPNARTLWRSLRNEYDFQYDEVDIASAAGEELVTTFNVLSVPTTFIDGEVAFVGVPKREEAIREVTKP